MEENYEKFFPWFKALFVVTRYVPDHRWYSDKIESFEFMDKDDVDAVIKRNGHNYEKPVQDLLAWRVSLTEEEWERAVMAYHIWKLDQKIDIQAGTLTAEERELQHINDVLDPESKWFVRCTIDLETGALVALEDSWKTTN